MDRPSRQLAVPPGLAGMRADAGISKLLGISRTVAAQLAEQGDILQDGIVLGKSDRLEEDRWLDVTLPEPFKDLSQEPIQAVEGMDVLYADQDIIAINKPVGVAAHPTIGWDGPTVTSGLKAAGFTITTSGPAERQGIVHRLDVGTSGVMVVAASERAYSLLKRAFKERTVEKTYHALVQGHPDPFNGTIDAPIGRHPSSSWRFAVRDDGKSAVTHYTTLEAFQKASLMDVHLETGRTHQIRVHFSAMHHPCVGDPMYGSDPTLNKKLGLDRQWLHAVQLKIPHPEGHTLTIESPYPEDLQHALDKLRETG